jgi:peptidoglycan lytic transglycosylase G
VSERTDAEREAARLERERRRAERSGAVETQSVPREPEPDLAPDDGEVAELDEQDHDDELPVGTRRVSRLQPRESRAKRERPKRKKRKPLKRQRRWRTWLGRAFALATILLAAAVIWFFIELFQPFHGSGYGSIRVTIPPHSSAKQIGNILERDGVVSSSFFFNARATIGSDRSDLRSGTYVMKLDMPYSAVLDQLTKPPKAAKVSELTITEGRTRRQIDALLRAQHIDGSYLAATRGSSLLNPVAYGAPRSLPSLEGFLFPSTYQLRDPIKISDLVSDQLRTFKQRFGRINLSYAKSKHLTPFDVLTIASMVQGEAQTLHDMPLIASVIYNRLHDHMLLGIDATTRYATGNYKSPLTQSQLHDPSPYNTRVHPGLPLGPINNPGLAAINAAAHPARTNYLYFVAKPCGNGASAFASNYAQFQRLSEQYQLARARNGGRSPTHC